MPLSALRRFGKVALVALAASVCLSGCQWQRVHRLTDYKYPPRDKDAEIEAFYGEVSEPHEKIAIIQSSPKNSRDNETKAKQLDELRKIARKLGADAIQDVRLLSTSGNGLVSDPATPFPSVKQGRYEMFFLRGEAIKYVNSGIDSGDSTQRPLSLSDREEPR